MSKIKLTGDFGEYWTNPYNESYPLTLDEMKLNATYIYKALNSRGWTKNAICSFLGNATRESSLNPGRWQNDTPNNLNLGYGIVQWTPASKYINWVGNNPEYMDNNLRRIDYEAENDIQYIPTSDYPLTLDEFINSNESIEYLTRAWAYNYERAGDIAIDERIYWANYWYLYLTSDIILLKTNFNFIFLNKKKRLKKANNLINS